VQVFTVRLSCARLHGVARQINGKRPVCTTVALADPWRASYILSVIVWFGICSQRVDAAGGSLEANPVILVVDDEPRNVRIITEYLAEKDYELVSASSGLEALNWLQEPSHKTDLILLDRMMPAMDGMELLRRIKQDARLQTIPVVMQTAVAEPESIAEGIRTGAHYYLTKPFEPDVLFSVVAAALEQGRHSRRLQLDASRARATGRLMVAGYFRIRTLEDAEDLAIFLAAACPNPNTTATGISELLINAIEHGNLSIGYEEKSSLIANDTWHSEIERRLQDPAQQDRYVEVHVDRDAEKIQFRVKDQGGGFDWQSYMEIDARRAFDAHGRGIALAKMLSFHELTYRGCGNEAVATLYLDRSTPA
jgi:CheY-like chemotaxis protein/anti-sigma regulatory factor (Ser/Thr protein kinase)